ncbi:cytochrome c [Hyphomicrobium sp. CS1GBMeth3]|uniref:c-type cytochrome n=1 Tax=Hyphomicrobium sp. CS1GBMeth3 TaxID=1892845 RepID=UPI000931D96E|nr:cytochrome c [Hyphomicrobium sp. CS1GBMeth3]
MRIYWQGIAAALLVCAGEARAAEDVGEALLERRCGRCHAVTADASSRVKTAPNLWETLRSYPPERLVFELAEGIGSRHLGMPQIQFTSDEIWAVQVYLSRE